MSGIRSMTGFGRATETEETGITTVTIRTVNHRNLEQSYRLPERLWEIESLLRAKVAERLSRGKVDVSIRSSRHAETTSVHIDRDLVRDLADGLAGVAETHELEYDRRLESLIRVPGVIFTATGIEEMSQEERSAISRLLEDSLERVVEMREREGAALQQDIAVRIETIGGMVDEIRGGRDRLVEEQTSAMRRRIEDLAKTLDVDVAEEKLVSEIALMADKIDIEEELTRLSSHLSQVTELLTQSEPVGRKLDFLCQEMTREVNTIGSKTRSSELKAKVIELKAEIERIREQVQNVE